MHFNLYLKSLEQYSVSRFNSRACGGGEKHARLRIKLAQHLVTPHLKAVVVCTILCFACYHWNCGSGGGGGGGVRGSGIIDGHYDRTVHSVAYIQCEHRSLSVAVS